MTHITSAANDPINNIDPSGMECGSSSWNDNGTETCPPEPYNAWENPLQQFEENAGNFTSLYTVVETSEDHYFGGGGPYTVVAHLMRIYLPLSDYLTFGGDGGSVYAGSPAVGGAAGGGGGAGGGASQGSPPNGATQCSEGGALERGAAWLGTAALNTAGGLGAAGVVGSVAGLEVPAVLEPLAGGAAIVGLGADAVAGGLRAIRTGNASALALSIETDLLPNVLPFGWAGKAVFSVGFSNASSRFQSVARICH